MKRTIELRRRLKLLMDDPMWDAHAEISKKTLREVIQELDRLDTRDRQRRRLMRGLRLRISELVGERTPVPQKYRSYASRGEGE